MYSTSDVCDVTGLTLRQAQWLCDRGYVRPTTQHGKRVFSEQQMAFIEVIAKLRAKHIKTGDAVRVALKLESQHALNDLGGCFVIYCERFALLFSKADEAIRCAAEADQPVRVVEL
jgi:DNA-binding transcriptional MerR regulator